MSCINGFSPVVVYTYNRVSHFRETIDALRKNHLANETDLFIVSDGPRDDHSKFFVNQIRDIGDSVTGFKSVNRIYRDKNIGAFESIRTAEHSVISDYGFVISMEDDIVTSRNYLDFMNSALRHFEYAEDVLSISGYCHPIQVNNNYDSWMNIWHCPWGYATWKHKYLKLNIHKNPYQKIVKDEKKYKKLLKYGNFMVDTLISDEEGKLLALDARICGEMLLRDLKTVMPSSSKVKNIGCDGSGLHSGLTDKFNVQLDDGSKRNFIFCESFDPNSKVFLNYLKFMNGRYYVVFWRNFYRYLIKVKILKKSYHLASKFLQR